MHATRSYLVPVGVAGCGLVQDEPFYMGLRLAHSGWSGVRWVSFYCARAPRSERGCGRAQTHRRGFAYLVATLWCLSPEKGLNTLSSRVTIFYIMHATRSYLVPVGVAGCGLVQDEPFYMGKYKRRRCKRGHVNILNVPSLQWDIGQILQVANKKAVQPRINTAA
ncbi:hypothetical protein NDU88_001840 [Pleurodeles waltl]|uniref:Uncharacterized protein n=1 Tax=Pleurodeles waltl TaxID=8319 RepID=A0AAV7WPV9_PLEWA|nr:hypothetical protein NDU88_001840 [Pleurodeles waltl]